LIDRRNIRFSGSLSDILVLDREVLAYGTLVTCCHRVLVINGFEVFALAFLYKGDSSVINVDNAVIEFEVISNNKTFTFLGQELGFFKA
jgi:hypothetical protein